MTIKLKKNKKTNSTSETSFRGKSNNHLSVTSKKKLQKHTFGVVCYIVVKCGR